MQTTLLGLGIAIILAIVSALVAPLVVDWNHYRSAFEAEASRLTGLNVRVNGTIDARILPSPLIKLRDVEVGEAGREPQLRAGSIELEVALGPLLRGDIQASEVRLVAPQLSLGLDRSGAIDWPQPSPSFRPEALSISRFDVEDGRVVLTDAASGSRLVLQKLWFTGDIRSFAGPFSGEGAFVAADELYGYRISGSHPDGQNGFKFRLGVDPSNQPLTTDIDGTLTLDHGVPQFEGTLALARPVGATLANGQRVMSEPWRAGGGIRITPAAAALRDLAFQYGPEERALNFTGKADLIFGSQPHLDGTVSALDVNADRALAAPDLTHQPPLLVIRSFLEAFVAAAKLPMPADLGVGIDALTLGGTTIQSLHGDMRFDGDSWSLKDFTFRAPGYTEVKLSGNLENGPQGLAFTGPAALQAADVDMLLAWLKGRNDVPPGASRTLNAQGNVTIASDRLAIDHMTATLDQENVEGRVAYVWPVGDRPAVVDAELRAAELDLDALTDFARTAIGKIGFDLPHAGTLVLDIGNATLGGVNARIVKTQVKFDAGALQIDRLSIADLSGAALDISGRIDELSSQPRGRVTLDLDARALAGLTNIIGKVAPQAANALQHVAEHLAPAKVHAILTVEHAATAGSTAKLSVDGQLGLLRVAVNGEATGQPSELGAATMHFESRLDADDASTLVTILGLDHVVAVDQFPGRVTLSAAGPFNGDVRVDGRVSASGIDAALRGTLRLSGASAPTGTFQVLASAGDLRPLQQAMTGEAGVAVPLSARAAVALGGGDLSLTEIAATVGKAAVHGHLALKLSSPIGIDGDIGVDNADAARLAALLLGLPSKTQGGGALWSSKPVGAGAFAAVNGALTFKLDHAAFTPALVASEIKGVARFRPSEIALDEIEGSVAGGRLSGKLAFRHDADGVVGHGTIELADADAATFLAVDKKAVDGQMTLELQCDGIGASPLALIRALHGSGAIKLANAHFGGLDAAAFDAAMRAADQGPAIEAAKIRAAVDSAMQNGRLAVPAGDAAMTVTGGKIRIANVSLQAQGGAALALAGALDLSNAAIDARMVLSEQPPAGALISLPPEITVTLKGPLATPVRMLDTSALTGWLTLRAAELQTRLLESIEANQRNAVVGAIVRSDFPAVRTAPAGTVVEFAVPAGATAAPKPGGRGFDRLQPELPITPVAPTTVPHDADSTAAAADPNRPHAPSPQSGPPPAPPQAAGPAKRLLDYLFRSQN